MDDVLTGAANLAACRRLREEVVSLCTAGGFPLRKWAANQGDLMEGVPPEHRLTPSVGAQLPSEEQSILGLRWKPEDDVFALTVRQGPSSAPTKRTVLSRTARLFDPLGWLAPIIVRAKLLVQTAWLQQLDWDAPLAGEEAVLWFGLEEELPLLEEIRLPRWFRCDDPACILELYGFSDASERAYAAVVYLRAIVDGQPSTSLIVAKTKVAPLRRVSIPRLDLCAAALLAKLAEHTRLTLSLETTAVHLWTDSTVTLGWVRGHPAKWTTYVANRVAEVHSTNPDAKWRHVPGRENPADCASRGVSPHELLTHPLWWHGPHFLVESSDTWPEDVAPADLASLPVQRFARCLVIADRVEPDDLRRFSALRRLLRVSAWIWRWRRTRQSADGNNPRPTPLEVAELEASLTRWIRVVQYAHFRSELTLTQVDWYPVSESTP